MSAQEKLNSSTGRVHLTRPLHFFSPPPAQMCAQDMCWLHARPCPARPAASLPPVGTALQMLWLPCSQCRCCRRHTLSSPHMSSQPDLDLLCPQLGQCLWVLFQEAGGHHESTGAGVVPSEEEGQQRTLQHAGSQWKKCCSAQARPRLPACVSCASSWVTCYAGTEWERATSPCCEVQFQQTT